jgi:serine/threonine protein kinase
METAIKQRRSEVNDIAMSINEPVYANLEYGSLLHRAGVHYYQESKYLWSDMPKAKSCWVIYLTVVVPQFADLLSRVLPLLMQNKICFRIPETQLIHSKMLDGGYGLQEIGKIIAIFPEDNKVAVQVASTLLNITAGFKGPQIPSAINLGNIIYTFFEEAETTFTKNAANSIDDGRRWPFNSITLLKKRKPAKWLNHRYLIVQTIKSDAKGNVFKALDLKNWFNISYVIVKQGNHNQSMDHQGRDIKDRLEWQYQLAQELNGVIPIADTIDYFEDKGDTYLVLEHINGHNLYDKIAYVTQGNCWFALDIACKRQILSWLFSVIDIIAKFHENGYIHRDISPGNFLVSTQNRLINVDIELAYDFRQKVPSPPFALGTRGYMSANQQLIGSPVIADDIYGVGALILKVLTGLSPGKLNSDHEDLVFQSLLFFTKSHSLSSSVALCLSRDSALRPELKSIRHTLEVYDALLLTSRFDHSKKQISEIKQSQLKRLIQQAISSFGEKPLLNDAGLWVSKTIREKHIANEFQDYSCDLWFGSGIAGVLYVLSLAEHFHFDISDVTAPIYTNLDHLLLKSNEYPKDKTGLFEGKSGIAAAINSLLETGLMENSLQNNSLIFQYLNAPIALFNLANGIAGKGLTMLYCSGNPKGHNYYQELSEIVSYLLGKQCKDGSWSIKRSDEDTGIKMFGFLYGIAGILYFLLEYYSRYPNEVIKISVAKGLNYLMKGRKPINGVLIWPISASNAQIDPSLDYGFAGTALTFIKAFEVLGDQRYKAAASEALLFNPKYIVSNYLGLGNGLSGLGEVYLEAFQVFKEAEWLERAEHIVRVLSISYYSNPNGGIYWHEGNSSQPAADLLNGNSGILHFLMRYLFPDKISFPIKID